MAATRTHEWTVRHGMADLYLPAQSSTFPLPTDHDEAASEAPSLQTPSSSVATTIYSIHNSVKDFHIK